MSEEYNLDDVPNVVKELLDKLSSKIVLFYAPMGAGKTTLIKEICRQLGTDDVITSPTFSLVNEYQTDTNQTIYHFDFYRIEEEEEAYDIGIEDYFNSGDWCFIEWPQNIENLLPLDTSIVEISIIDKNKRSIQLK